MADNQRIEELRRRVQKDPASIAFAQLAEELRRGHQFEEAIEACRAGLAIHPGYLSARVTLGRALLETNALEEARAELETVLKSAPENLAAIRGLAEILHRQGALPEALAQYRAALALAKNDPDLQQTVAELAKIVEPQKPAHVAEGLSFEQIQNELFAIAPPSAPVPPPAAIKPAATAATSPAASADSVDTEQGSAPPTPSTFQDPPSTLQNPPSTLLDPPSTLPDPPGTLPGPPNTLNDPSVLQSEAQAENDRAQRTIVALEQWLDAIHVARTQPRS